MARYTPLTSEGGGVEIVTSYPGSPSDGDLVVYQPTDTLQIYYEGVWYNIAELPVGAGFGVDNLLIGSGDNLLISTDSVLLI